MFGGGGGRGGGFPGGGSNPFATWTPRRKVRLARTVGIGLLLVLILWRCAAGGDDDAADSPTTTRPAPTTTIPPAPATTATATELPQKLPAPRVLAGGTAVGDRILLAGGLDKTKSSTTTVWSFDPDKATFTEVGALPLPAHTPSLAPLGKGTLVLGGGKGTAVYDTVSSIDGKGKVSPLGKLPQPRTNASALSDPDGKGVLVIGGYNGTDATNEVLRTTDGKTFTPVAVLAHPVRFAAVVMLGRSVWVIGGEYNKALSNLVQRIDLDTGLVTDVAPLPVALSRASGFSLGNSIFVAGGRTADGRSDQIYRIDAITGVTTAAGALPEGRSDATAVVLGDTAYLFGGLTSAASDSVIAVTAA